MKLKQLITPKPNEEVLLVVRSSFVPQIPAFLGAMLFFLAPFFLLYPLFRWGTYGVIVFCVWVVVSMLVLWRFFRRYAYSLLILTDHRLIDVDQKGLFDRVVTESSFEEITDVSTHTKGFFPNVFRYGAISVLREGSAPDLLFPCVPRPSRVQTILNDLRSMHHD